jgi:hypothetical protein
MPSTTPLDTLPSDLLRGANQIALFLCGDARLRTRGCGLCNAGQIPYFKLGAIICARKTTLLSWLVDQEQRCLAGHTPSDRVSKPERSAVAHASRLANIFRVSAGEVINGETH